MLLQTVHPENKWNFIPSLLRVLLRTSNIKECPKVLLNVWNLCRPLMGSSLSDLTLNVRKRPVRQVKFLHATFAFLGSRKRSIFHSIHFVDTDVPICDNNHFSESAIAACQKIFQVQPRERNNISVKPVVFFSSFFTHIEYKKKLPVGVNKCFKLVSTLTGGLPSAT